MLSSLNSNRKNEYSQIFNLKRLNALSNEKNKAVTSDNRHHITSFKNIRPEKKRVIAA